MEDNKPILPRYVHAPAGMIEYLIPLYPVPSYNANPPKIVNVQNVVAVYKVWGHAETYDIYEYIGVRIEPALGVE